MIIRRAEAGDIAQISALLYQVHGVHANARPDIFVPGRKKYSNAELADIISNDNKPVFVPMKTVKHWAMLFAFLKHRVYHLCSLLKRFILMIYVLMKIAEAAV